MNHKRIGTMLLLIAFLLVSLPGKAVSAAGKTTPYTSAVMAYQAFLKTASIEGKRLYGFRDVKFQIVDVNRDNVPELIINTEPFYGLGQTQVLYTYYKGKVKKLGTTGQGYFEWFAYGDLLLDHVSLRGDSYATYYTITKGKLKEEAYYYTDEGRTNSAVYQYKVNNKKVSKKTFEAFIKKRTKTTMYNTLKSNLITCSKTHIKAISNYKTVFLSDSKLSIKEGATKSLTFYSYLPTFTWSSSNSKIATVSKSGKITAKKAGTCTIKVTDGKNTKTCKVTVKALSKQEKAYLSYVNQYKYSTYKKEDEQTIYGYCYLDIDQNGTKELIVRRIYRYDFYTFTSGKLKKVGTTNGVPVCYCLYNKTNKTIVAYDGDEWGKRFAIFSMKNNKLTCTAKYTIDHFGGQDIDEILPESKWLYYKDGKRITGKALTKVKKDISGAEISLITVK